MQYEWDQGKRIANTFKHGVDFTLAEAFDWTTAIETYDNRFDYDEERWVALGFIGACLYVLVYTYRFETIRIISLRKANKREQKTYERQA